MYNVTYDGLPLRPTRSAIVEMTQMNIDLYDIKEVLEEGYNCPRSRRSKEKNKKMP